MSSTASGTVKHGRLHHIRQARRRVIKSIGKRLTRRLDRFYAKQSQIGDPPVFDNALFPFLRTLEHNWTVIHHEVKLVLEHRAHIPPFHAISPDQYRISQGDRWRTFFLYGFGFRSERNCRQCPRTSALLEQMPSLRTAWFSILEPGSHIPPHRGPTKGVVVFHLGLIVPNDETKCFIRVGDRICHWQPGRCFAFDDTYDHEVRNDTDQERVVLIFHLDRPMRLPARLVNRAFQAAIRWSAYVQEPLRNLQTWEDAFDEAMSRANAKQEGLTDGLRR